MTHKSILELCSKYPEHADFWNGLKPERFFITPQDIYDSMFNTGISRDEVVSFFVNVYPLILEKYRILYTRKYSSDGSWSGTIYGNIYDIPDGLDDILDCLPILVEKY